MAVLSLGAVLVAVVGCGSSDDEQWQSTGGAGPVALTPPATGDPVPESVACDGPDGPVFYVSPAGDDGADGSQGAPWQTLAKAAAEVQPGDTVYLMEGTYAEPLIPVTSGTAGAVITFAGDPAGGPAIIDGTGVAIEGRGLVDLAGISHLRLCNLTVRSSAEHGVAVNDTWETPTSHVALLELTVEDSGDAALYVEDATHVVIERNHTRESVSSGIGVWYSQQVAVRDNEVVNARNNDDHGDQEWISIASVADFEVSGNELYQDNPDFDGHSAIDVKESSHRGSVHHNYIHDFNRSGQIYIDAWEAGFEGTYSLSWIDVYANLLVDAKGITVGSEQGGTAENIRIFNNVIVRSLSSGVLLSETGHSSGGNGPRRNIHIFNNTIYECRNHGTSGIYVVTNRVENIVIQNNIVMLDPERVVGLITAGHSAAVEHLTVDHNLVFGPTECSNDYPNCVEVSGGPDNLSADPRFVDADGLDLMLLADSPAIDQGLAIDGLVDDYAGDSRPEGAGVDIGAYEHSP